MRASHSLLPLLPADVSGAPLGAALSAAGSGQTVYVKALTPDRPLVLFLLETG